MPKNRQDAFDNVDGNGQAAQGAAEGAQQGESGAGEAKGANDANDGFQEPKADKKDGKTYTDAELDSIIEARLAREKKKWEKALEDEKNKLTEAQKLEKMNAQEKAEYKAQKLQAEIDELKREKNHNEQMAVARKKLSDEGIKVDDEMLAMFVSSEAEKTKAAIDKFVPLWRNAVNEAVQDALKRNPPKADKGQGQVKSDGSKAADKYNQQFATNVGGN